MKNTLAILIVITAVTSVTSLSAHWPFRVVGTITRVSDTNIDVKKGDQAIRINRAWTTVKRDKDETELTWSVLKVGQTVVVDAEGDSESKLDARDIRIVPAIPAKESK
jgi:hypothetical protein